MTMYQKNMFECYCFIKSLCCEKKALKSSIFVVSILVRKSMKDEQVPEHGFNPDVTELC